MLLRPYKKIRELKADIKRTLHAIHVARERDDLKYLRGY